MNPRPADYESDLREHIPLQQGLRQHLVDAVQVLELLREHIPLQQGLRLDSLYEILEIKRTQRAYSITTRIKTPLHSFVCKFF